MPRANRVFSAVEVKVTRAGDLLGVLSEVGPTDLFKELNVGLNRDFEVDVILVLFLSTTEII